MLRRSSAVEFQLLIRIRFSDGGVSTETKELDKKTRRDTDSMVKVLRNHLQFLHEDLRSFTKC